MRNDRHLADVARIRLIDSKAEMIANHAILRGIIALVAAIVWAGHEFAEGWEGLGGS